MLVRVLRVLLLLAALVIMVDSKMQCGPDEHEHGNICCRNCMSGQYVRKPCSENHGVGECEVCGDETYTSHSSGLTYCLPCTQCRKDQEVVANCTRTSNRQCQCKTGFYCESEDREICRPCHRFWPQEGLGGGGPQSPGISAHRPGLWSPLFHALLVCLWVT
nr:tumor necrosis factor receptor superfamily member 26-like isoform X2 [Loxodonta africana]